MSFSDAAERARRFIEEALVLLDRGNLSAHEWGQDVATIVGKAKTALLEAEAVDWRDVPPSREVSADVRAIREALDRAASLIRSEEERRRNRSAFLHAEGGTSEAEAVTPAEEAVALLAATADACRQLADDMTP